MNTHQPILTIIPTNNMDVLHIVDTSKYNSQIAVSCPQLVVTAPGFAHATTFDVEQGFNLVLTACDLGLQNKFCETIFEPLEDGIYVIKYSVAPNEHVFVEYNHLRLTKIENELAEQYCDLDVNLCMTEKDKREKLFKLQEISAYLQAAKHSIEYCRKTDKGWKIYEYARKQLDKIICKDC